jgi:DNA-binding response OmpR family regulator
MLVASDDMLAWLSTKPSDSDRILIAEDDPVSRRLLEATLLGYGFKIVSASNGSEAIRILKEPDPPRLVITDVSMPEIDGLEVCKFIRSSAEHKHSYVILLTANQQLLDVLAGLHAGADDYIVKPFNRIELMARIQVGLRVLALHRELAAGVCAKCGEPQ